MKTGWIVAIVAIVISLASVVAFSAGHHVAELSSAADLAKARAGWSSEREELASQRADAINARLIAEHKQSAAINEAAQNYEKGKADAKQAADQAIADLDAGSRRLRDQWATCRTTSAALATGMSPAARGQQPDGDTRLRKDDIRRVLSTVGQCQAQRDSLQHALIGERRAE